MEMSCYRLQCTHAPFPVAEANILNAHVIVTGYDIKLHITPWRSYMRPHQGQSSRASYHDAHLTSVIMASLSACHFLLLHCCALPLPNILGNLCYPLVFIAILRYITPDTFRTFSSMLWFEWDPCFLLSQCGTPTPDRCSTLSCPLGGTGYFEHTCYLQWWCRSFLYSGGTLLAPRAP